MLQLQNLPGRGSTLKARLSPLASALVIVALAAACGDQEASGIPPESVATIRVSAPTTEIKVGQTVQLTATAHDREGEVLQGREFEWTSGIGSVASVSSTGLVTGLKKGQSEIRATTEGITGTLVITVDPARPEG
jgi:uncharacterized protein YjdB